MRIRSKLIVTASAVAALIGISMGVAYASIPAPDGTINGCYRTSNPAQGALTVIDSAATCPSGTTSLNWNQTGPQGPAGPSTAGPAGLDVEILSVTGSSGKAQVFCPSDHPYVLGGGSTQGSGNLAASFPLYTNIGEEANSGNGWEADTTTFPNGPPISVYAICAK